MNEPPAILLRRCKERSGIRLTRDYLQTWHDRRSSVSSNIELAYNDILADFLKTDMALTSEPVIPADYGRLAIDTFPPAHLRQGGGVVLQIQDTNDVSHSALSQLDHLSNDQDWPRGKLRWTLSDGHVQIQATEYQTIPFLNLKIPFGSKLLVKSCQVSRGMLMLTPDNVKWLGGGVPELYGGNMITELQLRLKTRLGTASQPSTPIPSTTTSTSFISNHQRNTSNIYPTNTTPLIQSSTHTNHALASELEGLDDLDMDEFNDIDMNQFDDTDMNQFNDIDLDDEFGYDEDMDHALNEVVPPTISQNIPPSTIMDDSDDDFVSTQVTPIRSRLLSKSPASLSKRPRIQIEEKIEEKAKDEKLKIKQEKEPKEIVHWVDPSAWMEEEEEEEEGVEIRSDGKTYVTFEALHRILGEMEQNSFKGSLADHVIVEARYKKMAAMRLSDSSGFYSIFEIGDPVDEKNQDKIIKIVIGNAVSS